jgi:Chaperone of endosialidase
MHSLTLIVPSSSIQNSTGRSPLRRIFPVVLLVLGLFALSPTARAVEPPPDGFYVNGNTAEGEDALFFLTSGSGNTAIGFLALANTTTAEDNTANGSGALFTNTTGSFNTAIGFNALEKNTASNNTATGFEALFHNTIGTNNTATGGAALFSNTTGTNNTATSFEALFTNTTGSNNTACGELALENNTNGSSNIGLGFLAGSNLTTGSNNIDIGAPGVAAEANTIRIGKSATQKKTFIAGIRGVTVASGVGVIVGSSGQLGTVVSSARFKEAIKPMDKASEAILALKPVTFRYKEELDPDGMPQFGLIAEEVEKVNPDLVARDEDGKVNTVRYEAVNAMLLNEFLKDHRMVQELKSIVAKQEATAVQQQTEIKALAASVKKQAAQLQKVSAQIEVTKPASQVLVNNP